MINLASQFVVSEELPEALAKLEAAQKMRHSSGVNVDVEESKEKIIEPSFKKKPEDVEAREGRLVRFDCVVAGEKGLIDCLFCFLVEIVLIGYLVFRWLFLKMVRFDCVVAGEISSLDCLVA